MNTRYPLKQGHTVKDQTGGSKQLAAAFTERSRPADIFKAPLARLYTRDYCKMPDADDATDKDTVTPFLGNPLIW